MVAQGEDYKVKVKRYMTNARKIAIGKELERKKRAARNEENRQKIRRLFLERLSRSQGGNNYGN